MPGRRRRAVLLTRPLEDSRALADGLAEEGIQAEIWPLTAIRPLAMSLKLPPTLDGLLFTSAHGVRAFAGLAPRRDLPALCVGRRTADVARRLGFAGALSAGPDAEALARAASMSGLRHFFHARGRDAAADLKAMLAARGVHVTEAVLYAAEETGPPPAPVAHALGSGAIGLVTLWSRRNAEIFARRMAAPGALAPGLRGLAISARAAEPLAALGLASVTVAEAPDGAAMRAAIRALA
ncbi:hypothetical protein LNKW23_19190 [Paralimibaculum aggregatum]|uniref:Tetrapyrrole biosynthesis uroporphyrinogen III synthase domain-containing protein n=1 Tax=Paralimibaculum aggregatum TaxID=3036245 RepID=A0ABQ6LJW1_9RHOB|nr:hypothetical protein LNKW23_19190 [Limibaculum sp. NKW23]